MSQPVTRRTFLRWAGTGVVGAALAACMPATAPQSGGASSSAAQATTKLIFSQLHFVQLRGRHEKDH